MSEPTATAATAVPIVLPCHGASDRGVSAEELAASLAAHGLAEVVEDIEEIVAAAREGRHVIALDGCAASCQGRLLDARGVATLRALNLSEEGPGADGLAAAATVSELESATAPLRRTRRVAVAHGVESGTRTSHSLDDYLLALDTLTTPVVECGAVADAPTLAAHVAHILGVSRPSAGEMLVRLEEAGYIRRGEHRDVLLTPAGRVEADRVLHKQRLLECFAHSTLGYGLAECYERAQEIGPGFDAEALERMSVALGRPERCPHGWPVEPERGRAESRGLVALSAAPSGRTLRVERVDDTSPGRLRALLEAGVVPGLELAGVTVNRAAEVVAFRVGAARSSLSLAVAAGALVRAA